MCFRAFSGFLIMSTCLGLFHLQSQDRFTPASKFSFSLPPTPEGGILPWWRQILCNPPIQMLISSKNTFTKQPEIGLLSYYVKLATMDTNKRNMFRFQWQDCLDEWNLLVIAGRLAQVEFLNDKSITFCGSPHILQGMCKETLLLASWMISKS